MRESERKREKKTQDHGPPGPASTTGVPKAKKTTIISGRRGGKMDGLLRPSDQACSGLRPEAGRRAQETKGVTGQG